MKTLFRLVSAFITILVVSAFAQDQSSTPATAGHTVFKAEELNWGDAPAALPHGASLTVLQGDPNSGAFTVRLKMPAGYKIPLHTHPSDELVTVISGNADFRMGSASSPVQSLSAGGFALMNAGMQHSAEAKSDTILQVSSPGAFIINYVDPNDDPRRAK